MLKNLFKYEFKALLRRLIPFYFGILAVAVFSKLTMILEQNNTNDSIFINTIFASSIILYIMGIIAMFVLSLAIIVSRFYKHLFTGEGYLSFSLPVTANQHLICKLVTSVVLMFIGVVVTLASVCIVLAGNFDFGEIFRFISATFVQLKEYVGVGNLIAFIILFVVNIIAWSIMEILMIYCAIALGQNFKSRVGGAIISFIILYAISQVINTVALLAGLTLNYIENGNLIIYIVLIGLLLLSLVYCTAYYLVTKHMMTKKLNLE